MATTAAQRRAARAADQDSSGPETSQVSETTIEAPRPRTNNTVTVACKVPNGLILQNHVLEDGFEPVFGGGSRPIKKAVPVGNPIRLVGPARAFGADPEAKRVVGGFGLTFGVPRDEFEKWMKDNQELDIVKNGLVFSHENTDRVADQARDMKTVRTGLEALNTDSRKADGSYVDPRMPRNIKKFDPKDDSSDIVGR